MSDRDRKDDKRRGGGFGQRVLALLVLVFMGYLIWLAVTGRYDAEVNRYAIWLEQKYSALLDLF